MAKPKRVRPTTSRIGSKINAVLDEKGMPGDYAALAKEFDVALTSVYGWVDKGRISKSRLPKLAIWSGRPLEWWLDAEPTAPPSLSEKDQLLIALKDWRLKASPRSLRVIDQLTVLAQKNTLRDEDWKLIEQLASRLNQPSP